MANTHIIKSIPYGSNITRTVRENEFVNKCVTKVREELWIYLRFGGSRSADLLLKMEISVEEELCRIRDKYLIQAVFQVHIANANDGRPNFCLLFVDFPHGRRVVKEIVYLNNRKLRINWSSPPQFKVHHPCYVVLDLEAGRYPYV